MKKLYQKTPPSLFLFLVFLGINFFSNATVYPINLTYSGANEVPPNTSVATGTLVGTYDDATNTISYTITFSGLESNSVAAHFHAPAPPGINAAVTLAHAGFPLGVTAGVYVKVDVFTDLQESQLLAGLMYSNIHTVNRPGGELRTQIFLGAPFTAPVITCPADTTLSNGLDSCAKSVAFNPATATGTPTPTISYRINSTVITSPHVFPVGATIVTAYAVSGGGFDSCTFTVTVNDTLAPTVTCPANIIQDNDSGFCGAIVNYTPTVLDNCPGATAVGVPASGTFFPVGTTTVDVTATDASGNTDTCSFTVTVNDVEDPVVSNMSATPNSLWPPNHKLKDITVNYTSTDNCAVISCELTVTSDEAVNGWGDGNTSPDWVIVDDHHVKLRAERSGKGDGRVYTITATCIDAAGNTGSNSTTVTVAHNQGNVSARSMIYGEQSPGGLSVIATPNPSRNYFTLHIETDNNTDKMSVRVSDVLGRVVETRNNLSGTQTLRIGNNLKAGIYFVELRQGNETQFMKLLKL